MTIQVEIDKRPGQREGDWVVRNGPGGRIISRHRTKAAALSRARQEAQRRGTDYKEQMASGHWRQGATYR